MEISMVSSPKPPDPYKQAAAQQGAEQGAAATSAIMNNPNRYNPWGSQTYSIGGYETVTGADGKPIQVPRYTETTKLSPDQMKLLGLQTQAGFNLGSTAVEQSAKLRKLLGQSVSTAGLQAWNKGQAPGAVRQDTAPTDRKAIEAAMMGRFNTDAATQAAAQDAQLAARGLSPGSAQAGFVQQGRDRARTDALQQAYLASGGEARAAQDAFNRAGLQRYQTGQDYATYLNQLRQGQLAERLQLRNQPINEITALMGGIPLQQPNFPGFTGQGINAAPIGGYMSNAYNAQAQNAANTNQGIFGLGSAFMGMF
jgi:hypothetical protein